MYKRGASGGVFRRCVEVGRACLLVGEWDKEKKRCYFCGRGGKGLFVFGSV